ncbi:MAG: hypothetical protein Q7J16_04590 [Candidatus Cloacimonadales bacterium]|nr:hypothetical protein [Candidatus Cloacimonadales bacterium]
MAINKNIDRRWIFLFIFICVALPLIFVIGLPIETTENARLVHDLVQATPPGSTVILSFDYDPGSKPELHPMAKAIVKDCFNRDIKILVTALWPMGVQMATDIFAQLEPEFPNKTYGIDYVNMGYKAGGMVTIQAMGKNFREVFPSDMNGTPIAELPILDGIENYNNISFVCSFSAGDPGIKQWVQIVHDSYGKPVTGGVTGVSAPSILPYVNEQKQINGLLAGLKGAAEYEFLIDSPGTATAGMDSQSLAHLLIIIFIAIGNINYWRNKKNAATEGGE